jgi:hypothetical protein
VLRASRATRSSEPHVSDAAAVAREVIEGFEPVKVIDGEMRNRPSLGQAQVDGDAPSAVFFEAKAAPADDTSATTAEVDLDRRVRMISASPNSWRASLRWATSTRSTPTRAFLQSINTYASSRTTTM